MVVIALCRGFWEAIVSSLNPEVDPRQGAEQQGGTSHGRSQLACPPGVSLRPLPFPKDARGWARQLFLLEASKRLACHHFLPVTSRCNLRSRLGQTGDATVPGGCRYQPGSS